jgi:hypothetical protein
VPVPRYKGCRNTKPVILTREWQEWRQKGREVAVMIGDLERGYMVSPINPKFRFRLDGPLRSRH